MDDRAIAERITALEVKHDHLREDIGEIKQHVKQLTALANRGRGSLATMLWVGGVLAAILGAASSLIGFFVGGRT